MNKPLTPAKLLIMVLGQGPIPSEVQQGSIMVRVKKPPFSQTEWFMVYIPMLRG